MESIQNTVQRKQSEAEQIKDYNEAVGNKKKVAAMTLSSDSRGGGARSTRGRKQIRAKRQVYNCWILTYQKKRPRTMKVIS